MTNNNGFVTNLDFRNMSRFQWSLIVILSILGIANLVAVVDLVFHPEIDYFGLSHFIVGGVSAVFVGIILVMLRRNIMQLQKADKVNSQSTAELNASADKWQSTFDGINNSVFLLDPDGVILEANKISKNWFGVTDILGKKCYEVVHKTTCHIEGCPLVRMKISKQRESMLLKLDEKLLEVVVDPIFDEKNNLTGMVHVTSDVTDQKFAEEALRQSEQDYKKLFENHSAVKLIIDPESGNIFDANYAAEKFYGWSRDQLKKMNIQQINILPVDNIGDAMDKAKRKEQVVFQFKHKRADGEVRDVEVFSNSINLGGKDYLHSIINDITMRNNAEAEIKLQNEKLVKLNAEKDKFFSIISHDLRSPFQGFLSLTGLIAEEINDFTPEELSTIASNMHQKALNLSNLLKNLFEWTQIQNGSLTSHPDELSLKSLVEDAIESLSLRSAAKQISVTNLMRDEVQVYVDEKMIKSVLLNLLSNAVKFTDRNGVVSISAKNVGGGKIQVVVRDSGIGMSDKELNKLFKLGEKIGSTGTDGELSTGLGLLLCKEFIDLHYGKIWAESVEGKGSSFYFTLPTTREATTSKLAE